MRWWCIFAVLSAVLGAACSGESHDGGATATANGATATAAPARRPSLLLNGLLTERHPSSAWASTTENCEAGVLPQWTDCVHASMRSTNGETISEEIASYPVAAAASAFASARSELLAGAELQAVTIPDMGDDRFAAASGGSSAGFDEVAIVRYGDLILRLQYHSTRRGSAASVQGLLIDAETRFEGYFSPRAVPLRTPRSV